MFAIKKSGTQNGGTQILFASAACSLIMFIILFKKGMTWTLLETSVSVLILICIGIWIIRGFYKAMIWSIISESLIGIYLAIRTIKFPVVSYNLSGYSIFLIACIISLFSASDWSWKEIGYPLSEVFITSLTILPLLIKKFKDKNYRSYL